MNNKNIYTKELKSFQRKEKIKNIIAIIVFHIVFFIFIYTILK